MSTGESERVHGHDPVVKGAGSSCRAECAGCAGKLAGVKGPIVGSPNKVNRAVEAHREETLISREEEV